MKKLFYIFTMVAIVATIVVSQTSCDNNSDDFVISDFSGTWKLQSQSGWGNSYSAVTYLKLMSNGTYVECDYSTTKGYYSLQNGEYWVDNKTRTLYVRAKSQQSTNPYLLGTEGTTFGMEIIEITKDKMTLRLLGQTSSYVRVSDSEFDQMLAEVTGNLH